MLHARSLKLKSEKEWREWRKSAARPANIPSTPHTVYKLDGWQGYGHWLGTGNFRGGQKEEFLPFKKALVYARSLKLKNEKAWRAWRTTVRPFNIPSAPEGVYQHDGWQGWGHWLGTGNVAPKDHHFLPFKKALLYARSLSLQTQTEWGAFSKSGGTACQYSLNPTRGLQVRRLARVWVLVGYIVTKKPT